MKTKTVSGEARSAYGKPLHMLENTSGTKLPKGSVLKFSGVANLFEKPEEVKSAGKWPSEDDIVKFVNRDIIGAARNKAQTVAFDAAGVVKPTIENSSDLRLANMVKLLVASGQSEDEATTNARVMLKMDDSSDDDDVDDEK